MLGRLLHWYICTRLAGVALFAAGTSMVGLGVAQAVAPAGTAAATRTTIIHQSRTVTHTKLITVHIKGRVLRRHDHILVVLVPRVVFHNRTTHRRIVVPAHVVRIKEPPANPVFPEVTEAAVIGVAPPPITEYVPTTVTVTVTMPVDVPGPTVTSTATTTVTEPASTVTSTIFTTTDPGSD